MTLIRTALACLAAFILVVPAGATTVTADGVVIFTQADVNAGNITPGDTPGFPATLSVSGNYRLGSALTLTSLKNGIVVSAPSVAIDLNKFKLSGGAVGRNGVVTDQLDTSISNGIIRSFTENGIIATNEFLTVDRVHLTNNGRNGLDAYNGGNFARIVDTTAVDNGRQGLSCANGCLIQGSTVARNVGTGIYVVSGSNVIGNVVTNNGAYGIAGDGSISGYVNNTITGNSSGAAYNLLSQSHPNTCWPVDCP